MAIFKMATSVSRDIDSLQAVHDYITDAAKTRPDLTGTRGCSKGTWVSSCKGLKYHYHKEKRKMYRHAVLGFDDMDKVTAVKAKEIGGKIAKDCYGKHYIEYAVHTNTAHLHIHFAICNTSYINGKQMSLSDSDLERIKNDISRILKSYGCFGVRYRNASTDTDVIDGEGGCFLEIEDALYLADNADIIGPLEPEYPYEEPENYEDYEPDIMCIPDIPDSPEVNVVMAAPTINYIPAVLYGITVFTPFEIKEDERIFYTMEAANEYADYWHSQCYMTRYRYIYPGKPVCPLVSDEGFF